VALFRFIALDLWQLYDDRDGNWVEKTWIKRGELRGFCGRFAGCCDRRCGVESSACRVRQIRSRE
jgi:hypothetical protein